MQAHNIVLGPELEGWYQNVNSSFDVPDNFSSGENLRTYIKSNLAGAVSLKLGYAFDKFLIYGKGGAAFTSFRHPTYVDDDMSAHEDEQLLKGGRPIASEA